MQEYNLHSFSASHVYNTSTNGPHGGNKWNKQHKVVRKGSKKLQVLSPGSSFWLVFPPSNSWPNATFTVLFHPFPHLGSVIMLQPLHCLVYSLVSQRNIEPGETRERSTWWRLLIFHLAVQENLRWVLLAQSQYRVKQNDANSKASQELRCVHWIMGVSRDDST